MPDYPTSRASLFAMVLAGFLASFGPVAARGDFVVTVLSSSAPVGGTGSFDVNLTNNSASNHIRRLRVLGRAVGRRQFRRQLHGHNR